MPTIGFDCQVILDGSGYFVAPGSYTMSRPKQAVVTAVRGTAALVSPPAKAIRPEMPVPRERTGGVPVTVLDRGPNQRVWKMDILCLNSLKRYDGSAMGSAGQDLRDSLHASYEKVATVLDFADPQGYVYQVVFTDLIEVVSDLRSQVLGIDYIVTITLTEAA